MIVNILDVSGFVYRAFYGLPSMKFEDREVGSVYGYSNAMIKLTKQFPKAMFIAAFDSSKKTFRNDIYPDYKMNRKHMPEELVSQLPLIRDVTSAFGFVSAIHDGYEADDIIASYVKTIKNNGCGGYTINVISSDKDLIQLLNPDENINIYDPLKQKYITNDDVLKKFGVSSPNQILDILSLMGDSSDNIPGIPGVGPKTAALLINEFGSLENLMQTLDGDSSVLSKKLDKVKKNIDIVMISQKLARLYDDISVDFEYVESSQKKDLIEFFNKFGFKSLIERL